MSALQTLVAAYNWFWLLSFLLAVSASWPTNKLVGKLFQRQMRACARQIVEGRNVPPDKIEDAAEAEYKIIFKHFDLDTAARIGKWERVIYVFGVMFGGGAWSLISGWLVLKAFNGWLEGMEISKPTSEAANLPLPTVTASAAVAADASSKANRMIYYHLYLFGNALSLMAGVALGFVGLQLAAWLTWLCAAS